MSWRIKVVAAGVLSLSVAAQHFWIATHVPHADAIPSPPAIRYVPAAVFARHHSEPDLEFVTRVSRLVHNSTYHCTPGGSRISLLERVFFLTAESSLRQGFLVRDRFYCGFCHQRSYILGRIFRDQGLRATVLGLTGHVVLKVDLSGGPYIVDPDYGVDPFLYANDDGTLASSVKAGYAGKVASAGSLVKMYLTRDDNVPYHSTTALDRFAAQQVRVFSAARVAAYALLSLGVLSVVLAASRFGAREAGTVANERRRSPRIRVRHASQSTMRPGSTVLEHEDSVPD